MRIAKVLLLGALGFALAACNDSPVDQGAVSFDLTRSESGTSETAALAGDRIAALLEEAAGLLEMARAEAAAAPTAELRKAVEEAAAFLNRARVSYRAERFREAYAYAMSSIHLSRWVIASVAGAPAVTPADIARKAIAEAEAWLGRAHVVVGASPTPEQKQALYDAAQLLRQARAALFAGKYREAHAFAMRSSHISRRIIAEALDDSATAPHELARQAIAQAEAWLARARTVVGTTPTDAQRRALAEAAKLLQEAKERFAAREYRAAISAAMQSTEISRRIVLAGQGSTGTDPADTGSGRD